LPAAPAQRALDVAAYYAAIAPFYDAEMALRDDVERWRALVRRSGARTVLDLGAGAGRIALGIADMTRAIGVDLLTTPLQRPPPFRFVQPDLRAIQFGDGVFELALAANDPFAHLLEDRERATALDEAVRVARRVVVEGLHLTAADASTARDPGGLAREATLPDGTVRRETWHAIGGDRYRVTYRYLRAGRTLAEATTDVRAWTAREPALRRNGAELRGGLDGRPYAAGAADFIIWIGGTP